WRRVRPIAIAPVRRQLPVSSSAAVPEVTRLTEKARDRERSSAALQLDLEASRLLEDRVDLERLLRRVELDAVDALEHVAVLDAELRVDRPGANREELE